MTMPPKKGFDYSQVNWYSKYETKDSPAAAQGPTVSINKAGRILINPEAFKVFGFSENEDARLQVGYMRPTRNKTTLVIRRPSGDVPNQNLLKAPRVGKNYNLNSINYLKKEELTEYFGRTYEGPELDEENSAIVINL